MTVLLLAGERLTVKTAFVVPPLPSVTLTSPIDNVLPVPRRPTAFRIAALIAIGAVAGGVVLLIAGVRRRV